MLKKVTRGAKKKWKKERVKSKKLAYRRVQSTIVNTKRVLKWTTTAGKIAQLTTTAGVRSNRPVMRGKEFAGTEALKALRAVWKEKAKPRAKMEPLWSPKGWNRGSKYNSFGNPMKRVKTYGSVKAMVYPSLVVMRRGTGPSRKKVMDTLGKEGMRTAMVMDVTRYPHNGCRKKKARRL